jgi:hypothetical protein
VSYEKQSANVSRCIELLLLGSSLAFSQAVTGSIVGNVTDAGGAAVAGAKVTITETSTGIARTASTNAEGGYVVPYLAPGTYKIEVEKSGFKQYVQTGVLLATGDKLRLNAALEVGQISERVEVSTAGSLLQTESAELNQSFEAKKIQELPLNGRNFQSLLTLVPGVQPSNSHVGIFDNPQGTQFMQVNGQNNSANNFQIDGVDNNEPLLGLVVQIPPAEAIQQFSVSTSNYDAEFGRAVGAVVNVTTKPGTNQFHGSLYEFHNNSAFKARNYFQLTWQPQQRRQAESSQRDQESVRRHLWRADHQKPDVLLWRLSRPVSTHRAPLGGANRADRSLPQRRFQCAASGFDYLGPGQQY